MMRQISYDWRFHDQMHVINFRLCEFSRQENLGYKIEQETAICSDVLYLFCLDPFIFVLIDFH